MKQIIRNVLFVWIVGGIVFAVLYVLGWLALTLAERRDYIPALVIIVLVALPVGWYLWRYWTLRELGNEVFLPLFEGGLRFIGFSVRKNKR